MGKGVVKVIELIHDPIYAKTFQEPAKNECILFVYKIILRLINGEKELEIEQISDPKEFWKKFCDYIAEKIASSSLQAYVKNIIENMNISENTVYDIIVKYYDEISITDKTRFASICATTSLLYFIIKELLDYSGFYPEKKKSNAPNAYKYVTFMINKLKERIEEINKQLN